ncbi:hypothetical protein B0H11DRAFT_1992533 [Mycena galericulata]|nr:hypothetical protein B0H11DRAFT_1992533 [Mycena galericulata]
MPIALPPHVPPPRCRRCTVLWGGKLIPHALLPPHRLKSLSRPLSTAPPSGAQLVTAVCTIHTTAPAAHCPSLLNFFKLPNYQVSQDTQELLDGRLGQCRTKISIPSSRSLKHQVAINSSTPPLNLAQTSKAKANLHSPIPSTSKLPIHRLILTNSMMHEAPTAR